MRDYKYRFGFQVLSDMPLGQPKWDDARAGTDLATLNVKPSTDDSLSEARLASFFTSDSEVVDYEGRIDFLWLTLEEAARDSRILTQQFVALRQGQPKFRQDLLAAYGGACAVTGTRIESVLEAAHIAPHKGTHTNVVHNGLLLRADVHTLFDLHLLAITDGLVVRTSPDLAGSLYSEFDGRQLRQPTALEDRPSRDQLAAHRKKCPWLSAPAGP